MQDASGLWINQINSDGQMIINAARSERRGGPLRGLNIALPLMNGRGQARRFPPGDAMCIPADVEDSQQNPIVHRALANPR